MCPCVQVPGSTLLPAPCSLLTASLLAAHCSLPVARGPWPGGGGRGAGAGRPGSGWGWVGDIGYTGRRGGAGRCVPQHLSTQHTTPHTPHPLTPHTPASARRRGPLRGVWTGVECGVWRSHSTPVHTRRLYVLRATCCRAAVLPAACCLFICSHQPLRLEPRERSGQGLSGERPCST